ncbi:PfkB domain protein [Catenulispora acidiphila DSM 44928]|uniref:PfkB domain protein n=1 Tax=Catenulispora acidiphila (strain DSM 44928 / JCM 14897 / NBRC 102108 / NRRL B-24433 / ID139908) TaxID=479433 RepID=C7Q0M9_CATAD|nr:sugar kinase [Catenulispora acidiphila]ACU69657.1 PfkB domain protein [Catenulispora acidiphila DSM 44928]
MVTPWAVCVGESMAALLPDVPGPLDGVESFAVSAGGAESNVACALRALGVPSAWISRVGDDGFGRRLVGEVTARGVDTSGVAVDPLRPTGLYLKETGGSTRDGDLGTGRSKLHYYRAGSAASAMSAATLRDPAVERLVDGARLVHLTGITPALSETCLDMVRALLDAPRGQRLVSFDLNLRPVLWRDRDAGVLREFVNAADVALLGADEAEIAFGTGDPAKLRALFPGPTTIVVKDAERVVTALTAKGAVSEPALTVDVVEPTGAGDAFAAGYLAGTLHGFDERRRLRLGHLAAASALVAQGDVGELGDLSRLADADAGGSAGAAEDDGQWSAATVAALLDAPEEQWRATRISADGIAFGGLR